MHAPVAVIGGGPAGASAALELVRRGIAAVLLEQSDGGGNPIGESLAPSATPLLQRLGLYDALLTSGPLPCHGNRSAWGGDGALTDRDFLRDPCGHGWHLDRTAFNAAVLDAAESGGVTIWRGARVISLHRLGREWQLLTATATGTRTVTSGFLIDATGRAAVAARRQGARRRVFDSLAAAVAILEQREPGSRDATTLVEAAANGWWYTALLPGGQLVVAWFTDPDLLARDAAWRPAEWWELLNTSIATRERVAAPGAGPPGAVRVIAAGSRLLPCPAGDGWIAAGDAAAAFDPLSSHGIGSALAGGARAAQAAAAYLGGDEAAISAYADQHVAAYARYLWLRHAYYGEERRWPDAPFWARRQRDDSDGQWLSRSRPGETPPPRPDHVCPGAISTESLVVAATRQQ